MDYKTQFIKNLKDYRKQNNLTQDDLAEMLGYSQKNIAKWEQGFTLPSVDVLIELSNKMGISLDNLLGLSKKTILEQCVDYVIEVQGLERETIITYEDSEETIEENVYGNVLALCAMFVDALVQKESFKELAQRKMSKDI
jgi:transcriptional regulator with XRE-family HTH domain